MQRLANQLIELLVSKNLVPEEVITELKRQVAGSKARFQPELLARLLVDHGHLTKYQATNLISELKSNPSFASQEQEEELGLAPSRDTPEAILVEAEEGRSRSGKPAAGSSPATARVNTNGNAAGNAAAAKDSAGSVSGGATPVGSSSSGKPNRTTEAASAGSPPPDAFPSIPDSPARVVKTAVKKSNPWDSFRILGVGVLLSLVLVAGFFLVRWMVRGSADDALQFADNAYLQRSYEDAANSYRNFALNWPTHEMASYAKVRTVLASLRKDVEANPNPLIALGTAKQLLPGIVDESGLSNQQSDLAGALVSLAEKFTARMDGTDSPDARKELMSEMDNLMDLIEDPRLVGTVQRTQLAPTLQRVAESRARIRREIKRDDELLIALEEMDKLLDQKDTFAAYEVRERLINQYPLLESYPEVTQRVLKASEIQRDLVEESPLTVQLSAELAGSDNVESFHLTNRQGESATALRGNLVYYRIKNSIYGIDAETGKVLWRRFIGFGIEIEPVRIDQSPQSDLIVTVAETGRVARLAGESGELRWAAELGELTHQPVVEGEDIFVATQAGNLVNLDAETGLTKWVRLIPQSVEVSPSIRVGGRWIYQAGDHSNLYVLDRRSGACTQVFYLGHRSGTIQAPPVAVMGHLILVENINLDTSRIRILSADDEGLKSAQTAIPMDGNVTAPPQVNGRQVLVQSNLGNSILLDVEPSASEEPVSVIARVPRNLDSPQMFWTAFENNQVWLAENRLARFDLIVTQGKLNRRWIRYDGDQFVGPLQLFDSTLIHARRPKGNQGVQVTAAYAEEGTPLWTSAIGAPVSLLHLREETSLNAVTTSGALYSLDNLTSRISADENPSDGRPMQLFSHPTWLEANQAVMLNQSNPREFALYSAGDPNRLRILTVPFGSAAPSCLPVAAGKNAVVGLDNGQLVMFEPATGVLVGAAYQAVPLKPGQRVQWNQPVYLPDSSQLIAACDAGKIVRLAVGESLRPLTEEALETPIISPLAISGDQIAAVESTGGRDELVLLDASTLKIVQRSPLNGRWISGPFGLDDSVLVQTANGVTAFDRTGKASWKVAMSDSPIVGSPSLLKNQCLWTTSNGQLWLVNVRDGRVQGSLNAGEGLSTGPLLQGNRILIGSQEGAVLSIPIPTEDLLGGAKN